jgi:hypothetical protein
VRKTLFLTFCIGFLFSNAFGQHQETVTYGFKLGGLYATIGNLPESIRGRDNSFDNSTLESKGKFGMEGGLFLNYKLPNTRVAIQTELLYRLAGENVAYSDPLGKKYDLSFSYSYLQLGGIYKAYPYKGANFGIGAFYGVNLSPNNIDYSSNEAEGIYDVATRQFYIDGLEGANDFSLCFNLGYELKQSIHFDFRYYFGVSDAINSTASSFQFIENLNRSNTFVFSIGYSLHEW